MMVSKGLFSPKLFFDSVIENAAKCWLLMDVSTLSTSSTGTGDSCVEFTGKEIQFCKEKMDQALVTRYEAGKGWC